MNDNDVNMTISCGLSEYPSDSDQLKDLIQFADEGLYKTKDERVTVIDEARVHGKSIPDKYNDVMLVSIIHLYFIFMTILEQN